MEGLNYNPTNSLSNLVIARLAPWLVYLDDGFSKSSPDAPRLAWLPFAMQHKPLFYATMLTAVVHLNRRRPLKDPSAMIWFKVQTIKLANEKMNDPVEGCTDEMIVVALVLCYFNVSFILNELRGQVSRSLGWIQMADNH